MEISGEPDSITRIWVQTGYDYQPDMDEDQQVAAIASAKLNVIRKNDTATELEFWGSSKDDNATRKLTREDDLLEEKDVMPPTTDDNGVVTHYLSYLVPSDVTSDFWMTIKKLGKGELINMTVECVDGGIKFADGDTSKIFNTATTPTVTEEIRDLMGGKAYHFDLSGMDANADEPAATILVTAVAESGKIEKYQITVRQKSGVAELDYVDTDRDGKTSTIGGRNLTFQREMNNPVTGVTTTMLTINVSNQCLETRSDGSQWLKEGTVDLMTVKNVAGERVQTITFTIPANGGTYVGETLNEAGNFIALPVTVSSRNTATLYLTVTSENGKNSHIYMITVNFKSDDSSVDFIRYTQDLNRLGILQIKSDGTSQDQVLQFQGTETVLTDVWSAEERYGDMAKITPNAAMTDVERNYYTTPLGGAIPHIVYKGYLSEENLNGSLSVSLQAKDSTATAYLYRWGESTPRSRQSSSITLENPSAALAALRDVRNDPDNYDKVAARFYGYVESALGERTYVVLELYNARKGEALIGRLDTETEGDFDLKPVDSEVFKDDTYAIWAYENNTIPTDYPANAKVENPFDTANPNSGWSAKLDDNGHILPESFTATISGDAAGAKVVVRAEHDGSWISISTEPTHFNDYTQGTRMWQGMFAMASTRQTLYIHVMDDDKGSIESNRNSFDPVTREPLYGRRYTLYLNPANTDRSLDTVTLMGDEDDLNRRGDPIKVQRNQTEVNVEVAPTSQTVDVRLITTQPTAMVEVFRMSDSTGTFNRHDRRS